jgi:hypothetical protein
MESRMEHLQCLTPDELKRRPDLSHFRWRLLAHGDSWFSFAAAKVDAHANLLEELVFGQPTVAVNCAGHHNALRHMVDLEGSPDFLRLIHGADAPAWDGILLSVGGNDLISAAMVPAVQPNGTPIPLNLRLLRKPAEWGAPNAGVSRYFSEDGWATFSEYLRINLKHLLSLRDAGASQGKPLFIHCYAVPTPRPAGADGAYGPWLFPALKAFAIPQADWAAMSRLMLSKMAALFKACAADKDNYPNLHVFDSTQVPIAPAALGSTGISGDWHNEIHLNHSGCFKIARAWSTYLEAVLSGKPLVTAPPPTSGRGRRAASSAPSGS